MITIDFFDLENERARHYLAVSNLHSRLFDILNEMAVTKPEDLDRLLAQALKLMGQLASMGSERSIPSEVVEWSSAAEKGIRELGRRRSELMTHEDRVTQEIELSLQDARNRVDRLCDCLVGLTNEIHPHMIDRVARSQSEWDAKCAARSATGVMARVGSFRRRMTQWIKGESD